MRILFLIVSLLTFHSLSAFAFFEKDIKVLTMQNGLADNTILCICKDGDGFMWFGTNNGLSRYDGKIFRNYPASPRKIYSIYEVSDSLLWLASDTGFISFNCRTEKFLPVYFGEGNTRVQDVLIQNDSLLWGIAGKELSLFSIRHAVNSSNPQTDIHLHLLKTYTFDIIENTHLAGLCQSEEGTLYIGTNGGEIITFNPQTFRPVSIHRWEHHANFGLQRMLYHKDCVWLCTLKEGLIRYVPTTGVFTRYTYTPDTPRGSLSHTDVYQLTPINKEGYLAATWNGYTLLFHDPANPDRFITEIYNNTPSMIQRNIETRMICAYYDPDGILWIGTEGGGVLVSDLRQQFYEQYHQDIHNEVCGMATDKEGTIWLATFHQGLMRSQKPFDVPSSTLDFKIVPTPSGNTLLCIEADETGYLWLGNDASLLTCYRPGSGTFSSYPLPFAGLNKEVAIRSLLVSRTQVWLGTDEGLFSFDRETQQMVSHPITKTVIRAITPAPDSSLWLGTASGLKKYHIPTRKVKDGFEQQTTIPAKEIRSLLHSTDGNLYIGYADGFGILDTRTDSLTGFFTTSNGLCNNFIGCMAEDAQGHLWLGTNSGITRYSKHQKIFYNYYISGNNRSALLLKEHLFWGNNKNVTYFNPENVRINPSINDHVLITQIEVNNKPVEIGEKINDQCILSKGIAYTREVTLSNANNSFSLLYSNLSYSNQPQKYNYRLTPYQSKWNISEEGEKISYVKLPSGKYIFQVRSIFPDGSNGDVTTLAITILPHWSELLWVRIAFVLLISSIIYFIVRRMMKEQARLTREERLRHELSIATLEREKERQINKERNNFFTNVSHELRTPLTLILSPLQELLHERGISPSIHDRLSLVYNNASFLSGLVDQLLYVQKIEAGMIELCISEVEIVNLVKAIMAPFRPLAESRNTEFILDSGIYRLPLYIDISKIESALRNLLSNALKYTPEGGRITVKVKEEELDGKKYCVITVEDTGVGIPEHLQEKVFDSFITGNYEPAYSTKVGIGLRIVKNTIDLHHGTITLDSQQGKGTKFTLYLPQGKEHFQNDRYRLTSQPIVSSSPVTLPQAEVREENAAKATGKNLLLIEDNEEVRHYIRSLFVRSYRVVEASNGEEGVRKATKELPDLIISDVMMPVKDGFSCCKEIRQQPQTAHIPIILLTAKAEDLDLLAGISLGIDDYIMKPFNPEVLKAKVENLIRMRAELKRIYTKSLMLKHQEDSEETSEDDLFMQRIINIVEANLTNPDFSVITLARDVNLSQPTLYRKIRQLTNLSIIAFIRSIRMSKAASLIIQRKYTVIEVAEMVGYNDVTTFRKHFTNQFGVSPSKYNL